MKMKYFKTELGLTVSVEQTVYTVLNTNPIYSVIYNAVVNNEINKVKTLLNPSKTTLENISSLKLKNNKLYYNDMDISCNNSFYTLFALCQERGIIKNNPNAISNFINNILKNPYIEKYSELLNYFKNSEFEITEDGCFLAYKRIRRDYTSIHDSKTLHKVGTTVKETLIDCNPNNLCSRGLHFCDKAYLKSFYSNRETDRIVIVKVNPKYLIAIPNETNFIKGRCSQYDVIEEIQIEQTLNNTNNVSIIKKDKIITTNRLTRNKETAIQMAKWDNDVEKVASVMGISISTVKRNMRRFRQGK